MDQDQTRTQVTPEGGPRSFLVGVGGGGCNAAEHLAALGELQDLEVLCINTDVQALDGLRAGQSLAIGAKVTEGLGAGGDPALGRLAAEDDREILRDSFFGARYVFLLVGLGGGTGTGAAPLVAQAARDEGALTIAFATLPFPFEGDKRMRQAREGLRLLQGHCDLLVCLPNECLLAGDPEEPEGSLTQAFARADGLVGQGVQALLGLLMQRGVVNVDFADVRQAAEASDGLCTFAYGAGSGSEEAITAALQHPLLAAAGEGLKEAPAFVAAISGGTSLALSDVQRIMNRLRQEAHADAHILLGASVHEDWTSRMAVTLFIPQRREGASLRATRGSAESPLDWAMGPAAEGGGGERAPTRGTQTSLKFDTADKGRFKNTEPTMIGGEDLDIPTFIRRGIRLSSDR